VEQDVGKFAHGLRGLRAIGESGADARITFGKFDVRHNDLQWSVVNGQ
jgi:hypothetical protein